MQREVEAKTTASFTYFLVQILLNPFDVAGLLTICRQVSASSACPMRLVLRQCTKIDGQRRASHLTA
jgi:hypothetical protein